MDTTELKKGLKIAGQVDRVNGKLLSYSEFVERYLVKNHPVVLTGLMDDWRACKDWVTVNGSPNLSFFSIHFGKSEVQVADCGYREFTDQKREEMSVSEFINHWLAQSAGNHSTVVTEKYDGKSLLYLKDWHFMKEYPEYVAYATPLFFCDDWLNLYLDKYRMHNEPDVQESNGISCSDYRFVYMGPKGTWTPLHADVFRSYSWSANVCGTKLWLFLPPPQCHLVFDRHMKSSVYNIFEEVDESKYPGFKKAVWMECTQGHNEVIFVPSGWYHQVLNLDDTISINHNWFNAYNLSWVWDLLRQDYEDAKDCIEDIRDISDDFEGLCQRNLAANTGMNFYDFFTFTVIMTFANSVHLYHLMEDSKSLSNSHPRINHIILNLQSIRRICLQMESTCLGENHGISFDFKRTVCDPFFLELCAVLDKTYQKLHDPCSPSCCENGSVTLDGVEDSVFVKISGSLVSTPENLVGFLDCVLQKLDRTPCSKINSSCP
ncbi:hypothetical protein Nepgr_023342 [Nepenthes gracilis]|uniref:JmjC domain-containing protein n=1 Tax=Nepenthes gracilis TaxID=150966 RepID=A0AAD3T122_NEPGR|nr:hypothetical protein Nepgr_023342 [Nepenthes gracilis]